jgi:hypothetical protein
MVSWNGTDDGGGGGGVDEEARSGISEVRGVQNVMNGCDLVFGDPVLAGGMVDLYWKVDE